jgi:ubiquinone/menaquinone biosynthesis C-methylase UbiE
MKLDGLSYDIIADVESLPEGLVETLAPQHSVILSKRFSRVIEQGLDGAKVRYIIVNMEGSPIALIYLVETQVEVWNVQVGRMHFRWRVRLAFCGNPIMSADCGLSMPDIDARNRLLPQLLKVLERAVRDLGVRAVLIRDIIAPKAILEEHGYFEVPLQPVMGMSGVGRWKSFSEYLSSMESKYRQKIKSARRKLNDAGISIVLEQSIVSNADRLYELYLIVARRAELQEDERQQTSPLEPQFRLWQKCKEKWKNLPAILTNLPRRLKARELNKDFFRLLEENLKGQVDLISLRSGDSIVAYTINFHDGDVYYSLFSGLDYKGDMHSIYRTLLSSKIERAIERGVDSIEFGRVALMTKAELGARGRKMLFCGRITAPWLRFLNPLIRLLLRRVPAVVPPSRNVFGDHTATGNRWYETNWRTFYAKARIIKSYDSTVGLVKLIKGGERRFQRISLAMLSLAPGNRVVDLCCGTGDLALSLADAVGEGGTVCGIDLSPEMIASAERKKGAQGLEFRVMDALKTDFPDRHFDAVTIVATLHEMPDSQRVVALAEASRILKVGGKLLIGEHFVSETTLYRLIQRVIFRIISVKAERATFADLMKKGLATELGQAGFQVREIRVMRFSLFHVVLAEKTT